MKKILLTVILGMLTTGLFSQVNEQDSLALVALYHATGGGNWANNNGWLQPGTTVDQWQGIQVNAANRVKEIRLHNNNLIGTIPEEIGNLTEIELLYLYENNLTGEIPESLGNLKLLSSVALSFSQLSGEIPPVLSEMNSLIELYLQNTNLTGSIPHSFIELTGLSILNVQNTAICQPNYHEMNTWASVRVLGNPDPCSEDVLFGFEIPDFTNETIIDHDNGLVTVYVDADAVPDLSYLIPVFYVTDGVTVSLEDNGSFTTQTSGVSGVDFSFPREYALVSGQPTKTYTVTIIRDVRESNGVSPGELSALIDLYQALDGDNWVDNTHWLDMEVDVALWAGVTVLNSSVSAIELDNNNLQGSLPSSIGDFTSLLTLNLASNQLTGNLPQEAFNLASLQVLDISNNPSMSGPLSPMITNLGQISTFDFSGTAICEIWTQDFQDWLDVPGRAFISSSIYCNTDAFIESFAVPGQLRSSASILGSEDRNYIVVYLSASEDNTNVIATFSISEGAQIFRYQNEVEIIPITSGETAFDFSNDGARIILAILAEDGITERIVEVYAELIPDVVRGVEAQDYFALSTFYSSASESRWNDATNWEGSRGDWTAGPDVADWFGVTVQNNRVTELVLPDNNIALFPGVNVDILTQLSALQRLDLSGNFVTVLPDLTSLENLVELNVANCYLTPAQLLPNLSLFTSPSQYSPQAVYDDPYYFIEVIEGNSLVMDDSWISEFDLVLTGNEEYQWYFGNNPIAGQNASTLEITDFNMSNVGQYSVEITHPDLPDYSWVILLIEATVLPANAEITSFSFSGTDGYVVIDSEEGRVEVSLPFASDLTALVPEFTLSDGATASYLSSGVTTALTSGTTPLDFSGEFIISVTSSDETNTREWRINVQDDIFGGVVAQDYTAILAFWFNSTSSMSWGTSTNWNTAGTEIADWFGVTVDNFRITELALPNNQIVIGNETEAEVLAQLTALQRLDLSGNALHALADMSALPDLIELNVANNHLTPAYILPNSALFSSAQQYSPQSGVDNNLSFTVPEGGTFTFDNLAQEFDLVLLQEDQFQWFLDDVAVPGATNVTLTIEDFNEANEGFYSVEIYHPDLAGFVFTQPLGQVTLVPALEGNSILTFEISGQLAPTQIDDENSAISISLPCVDLSSLIPTFTLSDGAVASVNGVTLESGITPIDFTVGAVDIIVSAENGDESAWTVTLELPDPISEVSVTITENTQCDPQNGEIIINSITQGNVAYTDLSNYTIEWSNDFFVSIFSTDAVVSNLAAGFYQLRVTNNATSCEFETSFEVFENIDQPLVTVEVTDNTVCNGVGNGRLSVSSDLVDWDFGWYSGEGATKSFIGGADVTDLSSGVYTLVGFYYPTGCSIEEVYEIQSVDSQIEVQSTVTNNTDCNSPNGGISIDAIFIDGNEVTINESNFELVWSHSAFGPSLANLAGGTYTVTITDTFTDCVFEQSFTVATQTLGGTLQVASNVANTNCEGPNGSASVNVDGQTAGFDFDWYAGNSATGTPIATGPSLTGRNGGTFTVKAVASGTVCESTLTLTIGNNPSTLVARPEATDNTHCENPNGSVQLASLLVNGANVTNFAAYSIEWSASPTFATVLNRNRVVNNLAPGVYYVRVTENATGCVSPVANVRINEALVLPEFTVSTTPNSRCDNAGNGTARLEGLEDDWTITWYQGEEPIADATSATLSGLVAGDYRVEVEIPGTGCTSSENFEIGNQTLNIVLTTTRTNNTLCDNANGAASLTGISVNGTNAANFNAFTLQWSTSASFATVLSTQQEITALEAGQYFVRVRLDSVACTSAVSSITIADELPELSLTLLSMTENLPGGNATGGLVIEANQDVNITWYEGTTIEGAELATGPVLENVADGAYLAVAVDEISGCSVQEVFTVDLSPLEEQTITFSLPATLFQDELPLVLEASSDKEVDSQYRIVSGNGAIVGNELVTAQPGELVIEAFNEGSETVAPATAQASIVIRGNYSLSGNISGVENPSGAVRAWQNDAMVAEATIQNGTYAIEGLREGDYIVQVVFSGASRDQAHDTYYDQTLFIQEAEIVSLGENTMLDIVAVPKENTSQGTGTITGTVVEANGGNNRIVFGRTLSGAPVEGVTVFLLHQGSLVVVNSATTDAEGIFTMTQVASGEYILRIDAPGYALGDLDAAFTFDESAGKLEVSAALGEGGLEVEYAVIASVNERPVALMIYPNPAVDVITIQTEGERILSMRMFNLSGQLVKTLDPNSSSVYSVGDLMNGVYLLRIERENGQMQSEKIIIAK